MELTYAASGTPPSWDPNSPEIEVWADREGVPCAYGQLVGDESWMHVPRVGSFLLGDDVKPTSVIAAEGAPRWLVVDTFYRTVMPTALQLHGSEVLHASAVVFGGGVLALCAHSETGKSTLAYALQERGHPLYADDAVAFEFDSGRPRLRRVPFSIRLRKPSAEHFGAPPRELTRVTGQLPPLTRSADEFAAICVLERLPEDAGRGPVVEVKRLDPAEAFPLVLPHAYCFTLRHPTRKALMMRQYLILLRHVPVFRMRFKTGLEHLGEILSALEDAVVREPDATVKRSGPWAGV